MCNAMSFITASAGASAFGAYRQAQAQKQSLLYDAQVDANNAQLAEWQAQDAIRQGKTQEQQSRLQTAQLKGKQRAAMAASGIALDEGSPVDVLTSTDYMGEMDALTIQDNAQRAAWGFRNDRSSFLDKAAASRAGASAISPGFIAATTLLSSAGQVAREWFRPKGGDSGWSQNGSGGGVGSSGGSGLSVGWVSQG